MCNDIRIRQRGSILLWVIILILTVSSTSLMLGRFQIVQHQLVAFYDSSDLQQRRFRRSEIELRAYMLEVFQKGNTPLCFNETEKYFQCSSLLSSDWRISARRLKPSELNRYFPNRFSDINVLDIVQDTWISIQYESTARAESKQVVFRALKLNSSDWSVSRQLLW